MIQRIDEIDRPAEVGRFYLVPTVVGEWFDYGPRPWPVIGPQHNDRQCLDFADQHYHLDARFMPEFRWREDQVWFWRNVFSAPLVTCARINQGGLHAPVWRRRKCLRPGNPEAAGLAITVASVKRWQCLHDEWASRQARHDGRGWVCPHRKVPLAGHAPDADGVITCPLHLLRIDAATGLVLPRHAMAEANERRAA